MIKPSRVKWLVGIDEAGRGPLAGPICVGALAVRMEGESKLQRSFGKVLDSKQLSPLEREERFKKLQKLQSEGKILFSFSMVGPKFIDKNGITSATAKALSECLKKLALDTSTTKVFLDGLLHAPSIYKNQKTIIRGDETNFLIALASVVAKVKRDEEMCKLAKKYKSYGFEKHKGYGTAYHIEKIKKFGPSSIHRSTFLSKLH